MMWFVVWAVWSLLVTMAGGFAAFAGALALAPFVLLLADSTVAFTINDLLDYDSTGVSLLRLVVRNLVVAVVVALAALLLSLVLDGALQISGLLAGGAGSAAAAAALAGVSTASFAQLLLAACLPSVLAAFVVLALSIPVMVYARRRLDKDKEISNTAMTFLVMLLGLGAQLGLTYLLAQLGVTL